MHKISKTVLFKTFKTAAAAVAAIMLAYLLGLEHPLSTGIVAILTIQPTKRETFKTALGRFLAFLCALLISYICFKIIGFNVPAFCVYLFIFIFVCHIFGWYSAMAMVSVLISHFLMAEAMNIRLIGNEAAIFIIGVGIGLLANLHLRRNIDYMEELRNKTDNQIKKILSRMAERIIDKDISDYNGECFDVLRRSIREAKNVAEENYNNQLINGDTFDREYIKMREKQCFVLYEMYKSVRSIETTPLTAGLISEFLKKTAEAYHKDNTAKELLEQFHELDKSMKDKPLPVERTEFEDRAKLYSLLRNIEEFLMLKADFSGKHA